MSFILKICFIFTASKPTEHSICGKPLTKLARKQDHCKRFHATSLFFTP